MGGRTSISQARKALFDPVTNTKIGTSYLNDLYTQFGNLQTALGAYKQGWPSVKKIGLSQASKEYAAGVDKCVNELMKQR